MIKITINKDYNLSKTEFENIEELRIYLNSLNLDSNVISNENVVKDLQAEYFLTKDSDSSKQLTVEELNIRINKSIENSKNNEITDTNKLLSEIEKWQ